MIDREDLMRQLEESDALLADGFEDALIGLVERAGGMGPVALYDLDKCRDVLMQRDEMTWEGAQEFLDANVTCAWVGDGTPCYAQIVQPPEP